MESQSLNAQKAEYRRLFKANLTKIYDKKRGYALDSKLQKNLKKQLDSILRFHKLRSRRPFGLLFYYPLALEFDSRKLLRFYRQKRGVEIFLPLVYQNSFKAVKYRLPLSKKAFNIYEPNDSKFQARIDCAVVPVLGVDSTLRRIGFGKGMYDRFFSKNPRKIPKIIFVSRHFNFTSQTITQSHDIRGDCYLTPHQTLFTQPHHLKSSVRFHRTIYNAESCNSPIT